MAMFKKILGHVDLLNCCLIWAIFIFVLSSNTLPYALWIFVRTYVWIAWIPLAYGVLRVFNFRKNTENGVLFIMSMLTIPIYGLMIFSQVVQP